MKKETKMVWLHQEHQVFPPSDKYVLSVGSPSPKLKLALQRAN